MRSQCTHKARLFVISGICLALALAVYCLTRSHPPALIPDYLLARDALVTVDGISGSAPSFLYTLAIALALGASATSARAAGLHCLAWTGLCLLLEISQLPAIGAIILSGPGEMLTDSGLRIISPYWTRGTFDPGDLLATLLAGLLALALLASTRARNVRARP